MLINSNMIKIAYSKHCFSSESHDFHKTSMQHSDVAIVY